jgi:hypothetical protein
MNLPIFQLDATSQPDVSSEDRWKVALPDRGGMIAVARALSILPRVWPRDALWIWALFV